MENQTQYPKTYVIAIGILNITTGMTSYKWSIYENGDMEAYLTSEGFLIVGAPGSMKVGDGYHLYGDQSRRDLSKRGNIVAIAECTNEAVVNMLFEHGYDYKPKKAFQKVKFVKKLTTSYVLK